MSFEGASVLVTGGSMPRRTRNTGLTKATVEYTCVGTGDGLDCSKLPSPSQSYS